MKIDSLKYHISFLKIRRAGFRVSSDISFLESGTIFDVKTSIKYDEKTKDLPEWIREWDRKIAKRLMEEDPDWLKADFENKKRNYILNKNKYFK